MTSSSAPSPAMQLIANVVIFTRSKQLLLTRYDDTDDRFWLPGAELNAYEHPDDAARRALHSLKLATPANAAEQPQPELKQIESFRGRRGWHMMFNYAHLHEEIGEAFAPDEASQWFAIDALPKTVHGDWEKSVIRAILGA
jgi:ADP-ribose pyrophosphatase YjhB (NUDIX family)